jgi:aminopeptidase N
MAPRTGLIRTVGLTAAVVLMASCTSGAGQVHRTDRKHEASAPLPAETASRSLASLAPSATVGQSTRGRLTPRRLRAARSQPAEDPYYPQKSNPEFDALHYLLRLDWNGSGLRGYASVTFRAATRTRKVRLDLSPALEVAEVQLDGRKIGHRHIRDALLLRTGRLAKSSTHHLKIAYAGTPHSVPAPTARVDMTAGLGWNVDSTGSVYTLQEPYGAFTWYPVNDHPSDKAFYDAVITTHGKDVAVFNGDLLSRTHRGNATTSRWHLGAPAASYLVTLAIGPYSRSIVRTRSGMAISYWVQRRDRAVLTKVENQGTRAFDWLRAHAGPYPFSSLGVVVVHADSAMETQTLITFGRAELRRSDAVLEHEMAHQWFGDSLTPRTWPDLWLNEGWAMYMQQWFERDTGRPPYGGGLHQWRRYDQQSRDTSGPPASYDPRHFGDLNVYLGPAMMLDAIRQHIGDAEFRRLVKAWPAQHKHSSVDREIFTRWLRSDTGRDLRSLLHRWLDSTRTPRLPG